MRIVKIPKGRGRFRTIYIPDEDRMRELRAIVGKIAAKAKRADTNSVAHGFMRGRSPVTNALAHIGHRFTLAMDLSDFFDSVTPDKVAGRLSKEEIGLVMVDGAARQGLPTSPAVANIAALPMDKAILKSIRKNGWGVIYTRYADDLSFSFDDEGIIEDLQAAVVQIVKRCGFNINERKTKLLDQRHGRRIITGVAVDDEGIFPPRAVKRRLRAALHQKNADKARGLKEWCKLKPPRTRVSGGGDKTFNEIKDEIKAVSKIWKISIPERLIKAIPEKEDVWVSEDIVITGDPIYMIGMSTLTTGWTSCMRQPGGQYRKGVVFWMLLKGTRVAALLSKKTLVIGGVERRLMRARTLVHEMREDGGVFHDRVYGNQGDKDVLLKALGAKGIDQITNTGPRLKVIGNVDVGLLRWKRPYMDTLKSGIGKDKVTKRNVVFASNR